VRLVIAALALALLLGSATAQAKINAPDIERLATANEEAGRNLLSIVSARGPDSDEARTAFVRFATRMGELQGEAAALDAEDQAERTFRQILVDAYGALERDARQIADGRIDFAEWRQRTLTSEQRVQDQIDRLNLAAGVQKAIDDSADDNQPWWEYLITQWWFWVFVGPETLVTVLWLVSLPFIGGFAGYSAWRERRRRRAG
jgi:hypothetical protein